MDIKIRATNLTTGEVEEITDLYWFEENGVHDFDGEGYYAQYKIDVTLDGITVTGGSLARKYAFDISVDGTIAIMVNKD